MDPSSRMLPPIRDLFGDALDGRHTGEAYRRDTTEMSVRGSRAIHEAGTLPPQPFSHNAYRHGPHSVGMPIQHAYAQEGTSTGRDSRHSSVSTYAPSISSIVDEGHSSSQSSISDTDDHRHRRHGRRRHNISKNRKEKTHRAELGLAMLIKQCGLECFVGYVHGSEQSAGNAKTSGLKFNKLDIDNGKIAVGLRAMDLLYKQALENGTKDELQRWFKRCEMDYIEYGNGDPTWGTLMYDDGLHCAPGDNGSCATHGDPDLNRCRRAQYLATFERKEKRYLENCASTKKPRVE